MAPAKVKTHRIVPKGMNPWHEYEAHFALLVYDPKTGDVENVYYYPKDMAIQAEEAKTINTKMGIRAIVTDKVDECVTKYGDIHGRAKYTAFDPLIADLIEKGLTYPQARRYQMSKDGLTIRQIAEKEGLGHTTIQDSLKLANEKLDPQ